MKGGGCEGGRGNGVKCEGKGCDGDDDDECDVGAGFEFGVQVLNLVFGVWGLAFGVPFKTLYIHE